MTQIHYAPDTLGTVPPTFAVVFVPETVRGPARAHIRPRKPLEPGPVFHRRVVNEAPLLSRLNSAGADDAIVLFQDRLPPVEWRKHWDDVQRLLWMQAMPYTPEYIKDAAFRRLIEVLAEARKAIA